MLQLIVMKTRHLLILALSCFAFIFGFLDESSGGEIEKGLPEAPPNTKAVLGNYYRGDGTGYNVYLTLKRRGNYSAEGHGCLGKYGESSGKWTLDGKRIILVPTKEEGMLKAHLKQLDIIRFKGQWIFFRSEDKDFYDKHGVSRFSCFQKRDSEK